MLGRAAGARCAPLRTHTHTRTRAPRAIERDAAAVAPSFLCARGVASRVQLARHFAALCAILTPRGRTQPRAWGCTYYIGAVVQKGAAEAQKGRGGACKSAARLTADVLARAPVCCSPRAARGGARRALAAAGGARGALRRRGCAEAIPQRARVPGACRGGGETQRERGARVAATLAKKRGQRARRGALRAPFDAIRSPAPQTPFEGHLVGMCEMRALEGARGPLSGAAKGARICLRGRKRRANRGNARPRVRCGAGAPRDAPCGAPKSVPSQRATLARASSGLRAARRGRGGQARSKHTPRVACCQRRAARLAPSSASRAPLGGVGALTGLESMQAYGCNIAPRGELGRLQFPFEGAPRCHAPRGCCDGPADRRRSASRCSVSLTLR